MLRLGIVGGGQLALYLCEAAQALGSEVAIIAEPGDSPALNRADKSFVSPLDDMAVLDEFLSSCDVVTFDKEAIPDSALLHLAAAQQQARCVIWPRVETMRMLNDKSVQKEWLVTQNLPTLPFQTLSGNNIELHDLTQALGASVVQKASQGGYDGRGVQILAPIASAGELWDVPSVVEPFLADCREVAVVVARSSSGAIEIFPPVSMDFEQQFNSVLTVSVPAVMGAELACEAEDLARRAIEALGGVGVFAVEMFVTPAEELLINEISPRVHNSGHVTMDACSVSQFEQHARAVLGMPLVSSNLVSPAVMLNILYQEPLRTTCPLKPTVENLPEKAATLYWYGKTPGHAGRKMGHINALGPNVGVALEQAKSVLEKLYNAGKAA